VPALLGPLDPVSLSEVRAIADRIGAPLRSTVGDRELASFVERHPPALAGEHQIENARIAVALARELELPLEAVGRGLAETRWPGRLERLVTPDGEVLLDAAHNPDGASALAGALARYARDPASVALIFGTMADKDAPAMLAILAPYAKRRFYLAPEGRRATDPALLVEVREGTIAADVPTALAEARAAVGPEGLVLVAGSIFLVGAARAHLLGLPRDPAVAL
jgi:dihydrofolate synthase/folylpolyglutamate synthase